MSKKNYTINSVFSNIVENKRKVEKGEFNSIPFGIPFLDKNTPGISKGMSYCITASTGIGKTKFAKKIFVLQPYKFLKENPNSNLKVKSFYIALEETKEEFFLGMISTKLYEDYRIKVDTLTLQSLASKKLDNSILEKIEKTIPYFEDFEEHIEVIDSISNPYGIYKHIKTFFLNNGVEYFRPILKEKPEQEDLITNEEYIKLLTLERENKVSPDGKKASNYCFFKYVPNDPNLLVTAVFDHLSF